MTERTFRSKVGAFFLLATAAAFAGGLVIALTIPAELRWIPWTMLALHAGFVSWIASGTCYRVSDDTLEVSTAWLRWRVPVSSITAIVPSNSAAAAPALSLDRLEIMYRGGSVLVSPANRMDFLQALRSATTSAPDWPSQVASPDTSQDPARFVKAYVAGILAVALLIVTIIVWNGLKDPVVTLGDRYITVQGASITWSIQRDSIERASLEDSLPSLGRRTNGFSFYGAERGTYQLVGIGRGEVFATVTKPPFVLVQTVSGPVYINFADPAKTVELFKDLNSWLNKK